MDEDDDAATREGSGLQGWTLFLDANGNGALYRSEPHVIIRTDGSHAFEELDPGNYRVCLERRTAWIQVLPSDGSVSSPDGFPDRLVDFVDSGLGPIQGAYGKNLDPLPGRRVVVGARPEPVNPSVILGTPPPPPTAPPLRESPCSTMERRCR